MQAEWLVKALDFPGYLGKADMNVPTMKENFDDTKVMPEDDRFFGELSRRLPAGAVTVLALSEPWCGDCIENLPVIAKMASLYPFMRLAVFPRDLNLGIMDRYLTDGERTIPIFVFFDAEGVEIGRFIERPPGAHAFLAGARKRLESLTPEGQKKGMYQARADLRRLYREGLRDETITTIRRILEQRSGRENP